MSDIENLRKQAKRLVRWHRDGNHSVAARIRAALPEYRDASDGTILRSPFRLQTAHELVAREMGFESWAALKEGVATLPTPTKDTTTTPVTLTAAEPQLFVSDILAACAYFEDTLGFERTFVHGEPPFYAQVVRDGARLNLRRVDEPLIDTALVDKEEYIVCSITVTDTKPLFLEFKAAGADFKLTLTRQPWGAQNFIVRDPDGNLLLFASP
ncbi:MAG: VOC family protein [Dehalococcoidia bacterium]